MNEATFDLIMSLGIALSLTVIVFAAFIIVHTNGFKKVEGGGFKHE